MTEVYHANLEGLMDRILIKSSQTEIVIGPVLRYQKGHRMYWGSSLFYARENRGGLDMVYFGIAAEEPNIPGVDFVMMILDKGEITRRGAKKTRRDMAKGLEEKGMEVILKSSELKAISKAVKLWHTPELKKLKRAIENAR